MSTYKERIAKMNRVEIKIDKHSPAAGLGKAVVARTGTFKDWRDIEVDTAKAQRARADALRDGKEKKEAEAPAAPQSATDLADARREFAKAKRESPLEFYDALSILNRLVVSVDGEAVEEDWADELSHSASHSLALQVYRAVRPEDIEGNG